MGIVITPTKGLTANIVFEISKFGVHAIAYSSEVLTEQVWKEITLGQWPHICINLEHLTAKDWEQITNIKIWRENIAFLCVDKIHLVYKLGTDFHPAFWFIGHFNHLQCTNKRPNIHFILQTLLHTLGGDTFPDLLPFLASGLACKKNARDLFKAARNSHFIFPKAIQAELEDPLAKFLNA
ncbi:hypothetical protein B0H34DRAFT_675111 [Crassisporium funariophilum]|nr:hypothetical protein B0H34DRAFT_675111 [Crassisporium funariophilum]